MLPAVANFLNRILPARSAIVARPSIAAEQSQPPLRAVGINDFLNLEIPAREMLLDPILPERSLAMLYAPRGLGKSWLALSMGLAVASGAGTHVQLGIETCCSSTLVPIRARCVGDLKRIVGVAHIN